MKAIMAMVALVGGLACADGIEGNLDSPVLAAGCGRAVMLSPKGDIVWEQKAGLVHDIWMLPNGNVLFADGNVTEVTKDHAVVFEYKPEVQKGGGAYSCQRLSNGNTVVGENGSGRVVEVDKSGKVVFSLQTNPSTSGAHHNMRMVRKLDNGDYLVCHSGSNLVREYRPDGSTAWEKKTQALAFAAVRLPSGNTLISSLNQITEYDRDGKEVWEFKKDDIPGVVIQNMTGIQALPNGNIVTGCYSAFNKAGEGTSLLEITRDKKLVWRYASPGRRDTSMMGVHKLVSGTNVPLR